MPARLSSPAMPSQSLSESLRYLVSPSRSGPLSLRVAPVPCLSVRLSSPAIPSQRPARGAFPRRGAAGNRPELRAMTDMGEKSNRH